MQVIVSVSGFYGGTWYKAGTASVEMPEPVARQFLPPYGDQLAVAAAPAPPTARPQAPAPRSGGKPGRASV